jgi:glycosyltransferase involved in cell wall biosynthesis
MQAASARTSSRSGSVLGADAHYLFYASQFRPNKNIVNLLRAYAFLLKQRHVSCKLVLTGDPGSMPEISEALSRFGVGRDVVFLRHLSAQELAACYRLATLAVNPSLFEAALPFTFAEALSVGTPVAMARIPPTSDTIDDPALARDMLFDPCDWMAIVDRVAWALEHRGDLLKRQLAFYETRIAPRSWGDALTDYVRALDSIGGASPAVSPA